MSRYVMIQSKSPWESGDVRQFFELARELGASGHEVTMYLVQNGVMSVRAGAKDDTMAPLLGSTVRVLADDFSLRERAIKNLQPGVTECSIDVVVDLLAGGAKGLWH